ncbi:MAG: 2-dehydro-3-deoxygalactonokinase [Rhodanobacteraceae bacterium]
MGGLIGLDWGTSALRAYKLDAAGRVEETRSRPWGIRRLPEGGFTAALAEVTRGWPTDLPRLACGMAGSRGGWCEVPYVDLPADSSSVASHLGRVQTDHGDELHLVPGLRDPRGPDMLRGEETQLIGALSLKPELAADSTWILPGTHSKWMLVRNQSMVGFHTYMTGELFALLREHSIMGAGHGPVAQDTKSFAHGVTTVHDGGSAGAFSRLFSARALMLDGALQRDAVFDYLSGLLIGEEFRAALADHLVAAGATVQLIGEPGLCDRYRRAAALFEIDAAPPLQDAAAHGLWDLAVQAHLTARATEASPTC